VQENLTNKILQKSSKRQTHRISCSASLLANVNLATYSGCFSCTIYSFQWLLTSFV